MENVTDKAMGYAWGRIDEAITGSYGASGDSTEFGYAYGIQYGKVAATGSGCIPALREAWATFTTDLSRRVYIPKE
jgi:hypothetical protein